MVQALFGRWSKRAPAAVARHPAILARPVLGWVKFCERQPDECRVDRSEPPIVTLTPQIWRAIVLANRRVNARIKPKTDKEHWGVVDSWDIPEDGYGDCEDY